MPGVTLNSKERRELEEWVRSTETASVLRRVQALLWLDEGASAEEVAELLFVNRAAVYKWVRQFQERQGLEVGERVAEGTRGGRPRTVQGVIDPLVDKVIDQDPRELGYRSTVWTAPLLVQYLAEVHQRTVSLQSVRLAIARLGISWKRPRHQLALRSPTWRQAKGGLNTGSGREHRR
jgi:transposase